MTVSADEARRRAREDPKAFWKEAAAAIDWITPPKEIFSTENHPLGQWYRGGVLNTCFNAVDRHVENGRGDQPALIQVSGYSGARRAYSFSDLKCEVTRIAGMLTCLGVEKGDRVLIYMPMIPQAVFMMLACARIGAVHSVVFGGFAAHELAKRIDDCKPSLIATASCGIEPGKIIPYAPIIDEALELCTHQPRSCLVWQRPEHKALLMAGRDVDWAEMLASAPEADCVAVRSEDPLYILYTSGTTGGPKGVVRDNGGHAVALRWSMEHIYGVREGEVFWAASDIGWVVGHSYIVYAPLLAGCATVLYEGKPVVTPDAGAYWRIIAENRVTAFFTAPTAIRAIKRDDPEARQMAQYSRDSLRVVFLAGERADPPTVEWLERHLKKPVIDHWWQTELGWPALATAFGMGEVETRSGSAGRAVPGYEFEILNDENRPAQAGETGAILIKPPLPPGCFTRLWAGPQATYDSYFHEYEGYYATGDAGYIDDAGFVHVMSRTDDLINVAGHRLSTGAMEQVLSAHRAVAECAVVGVKDPLKGQAPVGFVIRKSGAEIEPHVLEQELVAAVRADIGPVASLKKIYIVSKLPKTRSGKILRRIIRNIFDGENWSAPATVEDVAAIDEIVSLAAS